MFRASCLAFVLVAFGSLVSRSAIADDLKCEGAIVRIDGEIVTVKDMTKEQQMKIGPATKITSAGKPVSPMDLKVGQEVKCVCERGGEGMICTAMEIMRDTP